MSVQRNDISHTIALAGNPNAGKTTLFNQLTGARQHVGNYPGITVERKSGYLRVDDELIAVVDLPGTYSLTAYSAEELVARDFLVNERPAVVINIVDAANLERNLYLSVQLLELGAPLVIALNMIDVATSRGIKIDTEKLSEILGVPIIPIVARAGTGTDILMQAAIKVARNPPEWKPLTISYGDDLDGAIIELTRVIEEHEFLTDRYPAQFTAVKYLEQDEQILALGRDKNPDIARMLESVVENLAAHTHKTLDVYPEVIVADHRYGYLKSLLRGGIITHTAAPDRLYASDRIDKIATHRIGGPAIMLAVLYFLYQFTFSWSSMPVAWMGELFVRLGEMVDGAMADGPLKSLVISGVIDGVGGVLGFVPLIMFMFFGIALLEDSGYLARVAYMMDRIFRIFGLHGSSVMPFIVSGGIAGGCAVPGVMATRTLRSPKERMATLLTVPFMNCGAKIPVLALLIGAFFANHQALMMFGFTMLAWIVALVAAKFLRTTFLRGEPTPFVMELPPYRFPTTRGLLIHTWERTWQYIKKAGTVILAISILLWALMTYPHLPEEQQRYFARQKAAISQELSLLDPISKTDNHSLLAEELRRLDQEQSAQALRYSVAGRIGHGLESISSWAGFDWRTNIALLGGFVAKEVIVSTLGTAYSMGDTNPEAAASLSDRLTRSPSWNPVVAVAALIFIMFYAPCFVTVVCIARESSWRWAAFSMGFNTIFAFALAVAVYQLGMALGFG
jgi:ferrous iron transport protein B